MKFLVKLLPLLFIGIVFFVPQQAFAQNASFFGPIISPACECEGRAPDWGCVLATVQNLINFMVSLGFIIFTLAVAYAGLTFMASPINAQAREMGRTVMLNSIIGLAIVLSSWLLIDFVMKILYKPDTQINGAAIGPWNSILAGGQETYCLEKRNPPTGIVDALTGNVGTPTGDTHPDADGSFTYQGNIRDQRPHASAALASLLQCMAQRVPANVGEISSISDNLILNGSKTWEECRSGGCQHCGTSGSNQCAGGGASYHYGGTQCGNQSYAVDFGDEQNASALIQAANACGATSAVNEGNHVHVSVGSCN